MKNLLILSFILLSSVSSYADQEEALPSDVFAEYTKYPGYVMPEYRFVTRFQLLNTGVVQKVYKEQVTIYATLSEDIVKKLKDKIELIESEELTEPKDPICADMGDHTIRVQKKDSKNILIWKYADCIKHTAIDHVARQTAEVIENLHNALNSDYLK